MNSKTDNAPDTAECSESPWHPDDPAWMSERTAEWRKIQKRLAGATEYVPRSYWKHLKAYFFKGVPMPEPDRPNDHRLREMCRWWLHPDEASLTFFECPVHVHYTRGQFADFYSALRSALVPEGDSAYGVMGGREQLLKLALNPCIDSDKEIDIPGGLTGRCCSPPRYLVQGCLASTMAEIRSYDVDPVSSTKKRDCAYIAHRPGLVLWDHFSAAMEKGEKALYGDVERLQEYQRVQFESNKKRIDDRFDQTLMGVLTFFDRDKNDDSRQRPLTVKHVEYLLGRYENRDFSDPLLARWDRAKGLIKPGRAL